MASMFDVLLPYFVALLIGLIIGVERERAGGPASTAGSRTMPLLALFGAILQGSVPHLLVPGFVLVFAFVIVGYMAKIYQGAGAGLTTSIATILVFVYGVMTAMGPQLMQLAVIFATVTMALLAYKRPIHLIASRIEEEEQFAMVKFFLVALVVFPLLPEGKIDFMLGLSPRFIWLMVIFISAIDLIGYIGTKFVGPARGLAVAGVIGGFVSSTATTVSMSRRTRENPQIVQIAGLAIAMASLIMWPRIMLQIAVVDRATLTIAAVPLVVMAIVSLGFVHWLRKRDTGDRTGIDEVQVRNPFRLQNALVFGGIFAVLLLAAERAQLWFGDTGIYLGAIVGGLLDVNAITLTYSALASDGVVSPEVAARGIIIGATSNTLVKTSLAWSLGTKELGKLILLINSVVLASGLIAVFLI